MESNIWLRPRTPAKRPRKQRRSKNSCQVVPNCDQTTDAPLNTPDIMSAQLSFDDLFYTAGPELEQKLLGGAQPSQKSPPQMQGSGGSDFCSSVQIKQEPVYGQCGGMSEQSSSSCMEQDRRLSMDSLSSGSNCSTYGDERCESQIKTEGSSENDAEKETALREQGLIAGGAVVNASGIFPELDQSSLEIYRDLILHHLVKDIGTTCTKLGIPTEPYCWTPEDTLIWLQEMTAQFRLGEAPLTQMFLPGRVLCDMSQEDFLSASPSSGDTLYAQLQIWKTAVEFSDRDPENGREVPLPVQIQNGVTSETYASGAAADWLASFDPANTGELYPAIHGPLSIQTHGSPLGGQPQGPSPLCGIPISPQAHSQILSSPCASDSGISTDFDDFGRDNSPCSRQTSTTSTMSANPVSTTGSIHLWQFIRELLDHPEQFRQCVRWLERGDGIFKIEDSHRLARLWGQRKNRNKMNYDKLSRSLRQYYKKNIIRKTGQRQRLIYQFIPPYHLL